MDLKPHLILSLHDSYLYFYANYFTFIFYHESLDILWYGDKWYWSVQIKSKLFYSNNKQLYFDLLLFSKHSFFCTAKRQKLVNKSRSANSFGNDYLTVIEYQFEIYFQVLICCIVLIRLCYQNCFLRFPRDINSYP